MMRTGPGVALLTAIRNPAAWLLSAFGGAAAWALGSSVPLAAGMTGVMLGTAVAVGALQRSSDVPSARLRAGTTQAHLIGLLDDHLRSLRAMRTRALPVLVQTSAAEALAAADGARSSALRVALAVDELDQAISAACRVTGQGRAAARSIRKAADRLRSRRAELLERLTGAVDEVATVYARLLELSATARTVGVSVDSADVSTVNDSVVILQATFAELKADAESLPYDGTVWQGDRRA